MADLTNPTIERADLLIQQGNHREARLLLVELLKSNPTSASAWWAMSQAVADEKQIVDCLERTLRNDPNHEQARLRLEQIRNPSSLAADALEAGIPEELTPSSALPDEPSTESTSPFSWQPSTTGLPEEQGIPISATEELSAHSSEPILWQLSSQVETPLPTETPTLDHDLLSGEPSGAEVDFDLFAPGAFEKYNAEYQESLTPSDMARPWVEQLLETLNTPEEGESTEKPVEEVPAWAVPNQEMPTPELVEPVVQPNKGRMSVAEIILLVVLILLVLLVGGYFALSILGVI